MKALTWILILCVSYVLFEGVAVADECLECHREKTPAAVKQWQESAHAERVGCAECHGTDHDAIVEGDAFVGSQVCGRCHTKAYSEHTASKHGVGLHAGWGCTRNLPQRNERECQFCHDENSTAPKTMVQCARFLTQTSEMGALGCNRCHQVETSCASCHTNHLTDLEIVRNPLSCATCHMGPDHPQWEMWQTSRHGVLYETVGESAGPSCQRCHMPYGSHDVSVGITMTPAMQQPSEFKAARREEMLELCTRCHARSFAERELESGDAILEQSVALVKEAEEVILDLADHDLLVPSLADRPMHPLRGRQLVLDGQMLYEDISHIERLFFKMKKFDLAKTVKGAYHQNPAYTHWYGNAELKMTLADIKSEAARLKSTTAQTRKEQDGDSTMGYSDIEEELKTLKRKLERGVISAEDFQAGKQELLKKLPE